MRHTTLVNRAFKFPATKGTPQLSQSGPRKYLGSRVNNKLYEDLKKTKIAAQQLAVKLARLQYVFWYKVLMSEKTTPEGLRCALQRVRYLGQELGQDSHFRKTVYVKGLKRMHLAFARKYLQRLRTCNTESGGPQDDKIRRHLRATGSKPEEIGTSLKEIRELTDAWWNARRHRKK